MTQPHQPIGIFDSGVGGLTVYQELKKQMPHEHFVYFGDTARVPYGTKSHDIVLRYALQNSLFLMDHNVKLIVVACNTASAVALDYLQQRLKTPVVGVIESGAAAALAVTKNKRVGVIGTEGTIKSGVYEKALKTLNPTLTCFSQATGLFVPVIEEGIFGESILQPLFTHYLANFLHKDIDTLILGCTHYPILKKQLGQFLGSGITLVDSAQTTARQVWELLNKNNLLNTQSQSTPDEIFFSDAPERVQNIARKILNNQGLVIKQGGIN